MEITLAANQPSVGRSLQRVLHEPSTAGHAAKPEHPIVQAKQPGAEPNGYSDNGRLSPCGVEKQKTNSVIALEQIELPR